MDHTARYDRLMPDPGSASIDPELRAALGVVGGVFPPTITPELIPFMRRSYASGPREILFADPGLAVRDLEVVVPDGTALGASLVSPAAVDPSRPLPTVVVLHSGGMMFGDRFSGLDTVLDWVLPLGIRVFTVDYRLAPEHPHPVPLNDCAAAFEHVVEHHAALGVRRDRILLAGASAGAGLAAGVALAARDRGGFLPAGLLLDYPMLDDRGLWPSLAEFDGVGVWDRVSNETGWAALLGDAVGTDAVSTHAAPGRAQDLSGLPPMFLDVGTAEIFRDETVAFSARAWADGVDAEVHVWPGAFHACDIFARHAEVSRRMIATRTAWVRKTLLD
jgi:acetyl esterase/lipase